MVNWVQVPPACSILDFRFLLELVRSSLSDLNGQMNPFEPLKRSP